MIMPTSRRSFLQTAGAGVALATMTPMAAWSQVISEHKLTDSTLHAFKKSLVGELVTPTDALYDWARLIHHTNFDGIYPVAVAFCQTVGDVQRCVHFAQEYGLHMTGRCGGHSYCGYSLTGGLVIDVSRMNSVTVDPTTMTAVVGSGTLLIDAYHDLYKPHKLSIPGGSCPSVGVAGYHLGGGVGMQSRLYGTGCDRILEMGVVLADGSYVICNPTHHADLYWAYRGGGGGNFGIVTHFKFQCHQVDRVNWALVQWDWSVAPDVFDAWQHWLTEEGADWRQFSIVKFHCNSPGADGAGDPPGISMVVQMDAGNGTSTAPLEQLIAPLLNTHHDKITKQVIANGDFLQVTMEVMGGCQWEKTDLEEGYLRCHTIGNPNFPSASLSRETYKAKSAFFHLLSGEGIQACVDAIDTRWNSDLPNTSDNYCALQFDSEDGAMGAVPKTATAYWHRNVLLHCQFLTYWKPEYAFKGDTAAYCQEADGSLEWITQAHAALWPLSSGQAYQNYIDDDQPDWLNAYYGGNLPRLRQIKTKYDPDNIWSFKQQIPQA
jgi:FAD/FMN-containing dehydrogenase